MSATTLQRHSVTGDAPPAEGEASAVANRVRPRRTAAAPISRNASDDEILGIGPASPADTASPARTDATEEDQFDANAGSGDTSPTSAEPPNGADLDLRAQAALDSIPELKRAWQDAQSYRESFATPEEARSATALLNDLNRMDALFFSRRPEHHAELARAVANLDPDGHLAQLEPLNISGRAGHAARER